MHEPMQNSYPSGDVQAELARERNRVAADRTLLSFARNSATFISIGFGIDQITRNLVPDAPFVNAWIYILNLVLVGLGVMNLWFAAQDYRGEMKRLQQPEYHFTPRWSLGEMTAIILCITGIFIFGRFEIEIAIFIFQIFQINF